MIPGVLFGVLHHSSTPGLDPHPDMYKVAQTEVAAWPCTRDCFVGSKGDIGTILPGQCLAGMLEPQSFALSQASVLCHAGIWILVHIEQFFRTANIDVFKLTRLQGH